MLQIEGIDRNPSSPEGIRPLHIAAYAGNAELVRLLLDGHPESLDVNATTSSNMTALWAAAHRGQQEAVAELLQVPGIDTSATPHGGLNARETARRQGHAMVASILELHDVLNPRSVS